LRVTRSHRPDIYSLFTSRQSFCFFFLDWCGLSPHSVLPASFEGGVVFWLFYGPNKHRPSSPSEGQSSSDPGTSPLSLFFFSKRFKCGLTVNFPFLGGFPPQCFANSDRSLYPCEPLSLISSQTILTCLATLPFVRNSRSPGYVSAFRQSLYSASRSPFEFDLPVLLFFLQNWTRCHPFSQFLAPHITLFPSMAANLRGWN